MGTNGQMDWAESDWEQLLLSIKYQRCTPFIGAGASSDVLPIGGDLSSEWAKRYDYPFPETRNLAKVSQYVAVERGPDVPRYRLLEELRGKGPPNFNNPFQPHRLLSDLPLPLYVTTNYDDFMTQALARHRPQRDPITDHCRWYMAKRGEHTGLSEPIRPAFHEATVSRPVVFHLHGTLAVPESIVITEDDYLDFLIYARPGGNQVLPARVTASFVDPLLFLGYSLEDINFKVLYRQLASFMMQQGHRHVSVQLAPGTNGSGNVSAAKVRRQTEYLVKHFGHLRVSVYWSTCEAFCKELRDRWDEFERKTA